MVRVLILFLFICNTCFSDDRCLDLQGGLEIISKLSSNVYEADEWGWGVSRRRVIIVTAKTQFRNAEIVTNHFWIHVPEKPEFKEFKMTNGFPVKLEVMRESIACDNQERPKAISAEKAQLEQVKKEHAEIDKENDEYNAKLLKIQEDKDKDELAHKAAIANGTEAEYLEQKKAEKEAERIADRAEQAEKQAKFKEQEKAREVASDEKAKELHSKVTAWWAMPLTERVKACQRLTSVDNNECNDPQWYPSGRIDEALKKDNSGASE